MTGTTHELVDICICTYRRDHLTETLRTVLAQDLPKGLTARIIVADNDVEPSARGVVEAAGKSAPMPVTYVHAPARNISIARNACLDAATGDWLAFIDDDEVAPPDWITTLMWSARTHGYDAVFGPVIAQYPGDTPAWMREGDYHSSHVPVRGGRVETGQSGNVLMRWSDGPIRTERFLLEKGRTGGEDVEFFFRLTRLGCRLGAEEAAKLYEEAPEHRLSYRWLVERKFIAGQFHGAHSGPAEAGRGYRLKLLMLSGLKAGYSFAVALALCWSQSLRIRWALRGWMHAGVCAAVLGIGQAERY